MKPSNVTKSASGISPLNMEEKYGDLTILQVHIFEDDSDIFKI